MGIYMKSLLFIINFTVNYACQFTLFIKFALRANKVMYAVAGGEK